VTLGIADHPAINQAITAAPPLVEVLPAFLDFVSDLPLVAHNARFDARFLSAALDDHPLTNPIVDNLELALLLLPNLASHQLAKVAEAADLSVDDLTAEWAILDLDSNFAGHTVSVATLHNAVTDVYVLHRVYQRLLEVFDDPGLVHDLLNALLPEAFVPDAVFTGVDDVLLAPLRAQCDWAMRPAEATPAPRRPDRM